MFTQYNESWTFIFGLITGPYPYVGYELGFWMFANCAVKIVDFLAQLKILFFTFYEVMPILI
jgi:hypothetical protein